MRSVQGTEEGRIRRGVTRPAWQRCCHRHIEGERGCGSQSDHSRSNPTSWRRGVFALDKPWILFTSLTISLNLINNGKMETPSLPPKARSPRADAILTAVIPVFGRFGFKKTSIDDLAIAAALSKQGLYLHFSSKEEIFSLALQHYLDEGLALVDRALVQERVVLSERLVAAMNAWFGRHLATFSPEAFDVIETGNSLAPERVDHYKIAVRRSIATALMQSPEFSAAHTVSAEELSRVLFTFGLTWKESRRSRADFIDDMRLCVKACLPASNSTRAAHVSTASKTPAKATSSRSAR